MSFLNTNGLTVQKPGKINFYKVTVWLVLLLLLTDTVYSSWYGIHYHTREKCIIYRFLPSWLFMINEYLVELFLIVVAGSFAGTIVEKYFSKYRRFLPQNQLSAFLYASVIPVCSCSAIPLIETMKSRLPLRTIITFVMAAPLLNPYILFLSWSILGVWYTALRIAGSFLIAIITGWAVEIAYHKMRKPEIGIYKSCKPSTCSVTAGKDVYQKTWQLVGKIAPFILIAGILGLTFELLEPLKLIDNLSLHNNFLSLIVITAIGTAIYLCNGADILFLAPLLQYTDLGAGGAIAFSLSSTAVCASSIIMLSRFIGKRLTSILVLTTILIILIFSFTINLFS
ncbi:permease [Mangrovibacterium lignilyticum]|uniref:permease n=1 Tax=Mangrovibacterium lignilyticum TaxID=2668052 RepID=UPI0013D1AD3E|nr:permease [Mangrovibacterium lignilyticum]